MWCQSPLVGLGHWVSEEQAVCPAHPAPLPHLQLNGGVARKDRCQLHGDPTKAQKI